MTVDILDVGQGDAILIRTPADKIILIDAGDSPGQVLSMLRDRQVTHIDLAVGTHPHADHIGGMRSVVSELPVKLYSDNGLPHSTNVYRGLMTAIEQRGITYRGAVVGTMYRLDDGAELEVLFPTGHTLKGTRSDLNSNSVVLRLVHRGHCFLFVGDSEEPTENALLTNDALGACDVLKVAHHGSPHSSTLPFLQRIKPRIAIISVGVDNDYGHPGQEVLERLTSIGAVVHRTDRDGTVTILSTDTGIEVRTEKKASTVADSFPTAAKRPQVVDQPPLAPPPAAACAFISSSSSHVFHEATCGSAHRIKPSNRRCFASKAAAISAGQSSAGCCKP